MSPLRPPCSEAEFNAAMEQIDRKLQDEAVPIHARGLRASLEYSRRFRLAFPMSLGGRAGTPGDYTDRNVDAHIQAWFERRYGARQKIFMGPGKTAVLIRGDAWEVRLPLIYGRARLVIERDLDRYRTQPSVGVDGNLPIVNVLQLIESLPQSLAAQLTDRECGEILACFLEALECMNAIDSLSGKPYVAEARADIAAAVAHVFAVPSHYGQSKWASSQATEKLIKSLLKSCGVSFPKNHDLKGLADLARGTGATLDDSKLTLAAAPAGVRYGEISVSLSEALDAHHAALFIGRQISRAFGTRAVGAGVPRGFDTILEPGRFYANPNLGTHYFCEKIEEDVATIVLVESYQDGNLIQVRYRQNVKYQSQFLPVADLNEVQRLKTLYDKVLAADAKENPPGRNDPCICGSGKKFKHCHGRMPPASGLGRADRVRRKNAASSSFPNG